MSPTSGRNPTSMRFRRISKRTSRFSSSDDDEPGVDPFIRWRVNLAVDNSDLDGRPVVMETEPSYTNLFGTIERTHAALR